jgi:hypothetical protein
MGFQVTYKKLFQVHLWHHYLLNKGDEDFEDIASEKIKNQILDLYNIHNYLSIEPTRETLKKLKKQQLVLRKSKYGFTVGIKVGESESDGQTIYTPFIDWGNMFSLTFAIKVKDPDFFNFTNFPHKNVSSGTFYFTNRNKNNWVYPSLSSPVNAFSKDNYYYPGALATSNKKMYEAITEIEKGTSTKVSNKEQWMEVPFKSYFHPEDTIVLSNNLFEYNVPHPNIQEIKVQLTHLDFPDGPKEYNWTISGPNPLTTVQIEMYKFAQGHYGLTMQYPDSKKDTLQFYWEPGLFEEKPFALIDIANYIGQKEDYMILEPGSTKLRTEDQMRTFEIRLKNRSTFWCYILDKALPNGNYGNFEPIDKENKRFVYKDIKQLTRFATEIKKFSEDGFLPNPDAHNIYPKRNSYPLPEMALKIYSEIFL